VVGPADRVLVTPLTLAAQNRASNLALLRIDRASDAEFAGQRPDYFKFG
jgi:hypothetical protein